MKICALCKENKDLEQFSKDKTVIGGHRSYCKPCQKYKARLNGRIRYKNGKRKQYNKDNAGIISSKYNEWRLNNLPSISKRASERYNNDPEYKLKHILRVRIQKALRLNCRKTSSTELLGCSISEYKLYLESKFTDNMSWENYGRKGWHIDHIKSCASFDLTKLEEQQKCFHYTNTQPLWWIDNLKKHNKVI